LGPITPVIDEGCTSKLRSDRALMPPKDFDRFSTLRKLIALCSN
jgi:hypothetical protein